MSDASSSSMQGVTAPLPLIRCPVCGRAIVRTYIVRRAGENLGRRFYKCPNSGAGGCTFWEWHEQYANIIRRMQMGRGRWRLHLLEEPVPDELTEEYLDRIKVAYTLLAFSTFLAPRGVNAEVSDELLACVVEPREIPEYNWARYILDVIKVGAKHLQQALKCKTGGVLLCGCQLFLQICYLESFKFEGDYVDALGGEPLIAHYGASRLARLIGLDTIDTAEGKEYGKMQECKWIRTVCLDDLTIEIDRVIVQLVANENQVNDDQEPVTPAVVPHTQHNMDCTVIANMIQALDYMLSI